MIHWFRVIFSSYNRWFCEATFTYTHWMPRCAWGSRIPETFINTAIQQDNCTLSLVPCFENNSVANHLQKGSYIEPTLLLLPVHVVVHVIKEGLYCWLILDPWSWLQTYRILNLESWILILDHDSKPMLLAGRVTRKTFQSHQYDPGSCLRHWRHAEDAISLHYSPVRTHYSRILNLESWILTLFPL